MYRKISSLVMQKSYIVLPEVLYIIYERTTDRRRKNAGHESVGFYFNAKLTFKYPLLPLGHVSQRLVEYIGILTLFELGVEFTPPPLGVKSFKTRNVMDKKLF